MPKSKLDTLLAQVCVQYKAAKKACPKPGTAARKQLQQSFVAQLVQQAEFDVAGKQLKVAVKQKDIDSSLQKLELQYAKGANGKVDAAKWKKVLTDNHTSEANVLDNIKDGLLRQAIYVKLTKNVTVADAAVADVLQQEQGHLRHARQSRDPPHPRQGQGARRQDLPAARHERRAVRGAREEVHDRPGVEEERRKARQHPEGPDRPDLRQGRVQHPDRQGLEARQEQLRVARDRGHRPIPSRHPSSRSTRR